MDMTNEQRDQEPEEEKQERTFLTFSDFDTFRNNFPQTKPKEPQQVTAAIKVPHYIQTESHIFITNKKDLSLNENKQLFIVLRQPVANSVTVFSDQTKLTNYL